MTDRLQLALAEVERLPAEDQNAIAEWLLAELASERRWERAFAGSQDALARLADAALAEQVG